MAATLVFLTPWGALLALLGIVPLGALALASGRERRARAALGLSAPDARRRWWRALAVTAVAALLGVAASQPVLRTTHSIPVRSDAEVLFVIDGSRSMLASSAPGARTRIARARTGAVLLRSRLLDVPSGVATLTDRVVPNLLPVPEADVFEQTVRRAVRVDNPPPAAESVTATDLGALGATPSFFAPSARKRIAVVFTDGESSPFDVAETARALANAPGVTPVFVRVSSPGEAVFDADGQRETAYHPDATSGATLAELAQAAGGRTFGERDLGAAASAIRAALGRGPVEPQGTTVTTRALAPYAALLALVPLLFLLAPAGLARLVLSRRRRRPSGQAIASSTTAPLGSTSA